jgi:alpha-tubulin suppressor-like RCC1 family protein
MGYAHMFAKKTDGTLWSWGTNSQGQLGLNNQTQYSSPKQVGGATWGTDRDTHGMKGTTGSTYVVDASGNLWSWGQNVFGNLGHNNQTQYSSPKQVPGTWTTLSHNTYAHIVQGRKSDGTLWFWGTNGGGSVPSPSTYYSSPVQQGTKTDWALGKHDASNQGSGGVDTSGNLYRWGQNQYGNLGDNGTTAAPGDYTKQVPGTWKNMRLSWDATIATKEP